MGLEDSELALANDDIQSKLPAQQIHLVDETLSYMVSCTELELSML